MLVDPAAAHFWLAAAGVNQYYLSVFSHHYILFFRRFFGKKLKFVHICGWRHQFAYIKSDVLREIEGKENSAVVWLWLIFICYFQ